MTLRISATIAIDPLFEILRTVIGHQQLHQPAKPHRHKQRPITHHHGRGPCKCIFLSALPLKRLPFARPPFFGFTRKRRLLFVRRPGPAQGCSRFTHRVATAAFPMMSGPLSAPFLHRFPSPVQAPRAPDLSPWDLFPPAPAGFEVSRWRSCSTVSSALASRPLTLPPVSHAPVCPISPPAHTTPRCISVARDAFLLVAFSLVLLRPSVALPEVTTFGILDFDSAAATWDSLSYRFRVFREKGCRDALRDGQACILRPLRLRGQPGGEHTSPGSVSSWAAVIGYGSLPRPVLICRRLVFSSARWAASWCLFQGTAPAGCSIVRWCSLCDARRVLGGASHFGFTPCITLAS